MKDAMAIFYSPTVHSSVSIEWEPLDEMKDIVREGRGGIPLTKSPTPEMQRPKSPTILDIPHLDIKNRANKLSGQEEHENKQNDLF